MKPKGEAFDGHAAQMRDSPWVASEDLDALGGTAVVTIKSVERYKEIEFEQGRKKQNVYTLSFEESKRELVINGTNRKFLMAQFGLFAKDWRGKKVELYVENGIRVGGEVKRGIRIRLPKGQK